MSLQHFYLRDQVLADEEAPAFPLRLSPDDAKHARVLRLAPGEHIAVVDAAQDYFACEITAFDDAVPVVRIAQRLDDDERPSVMLVQGLAKGDKMETVIRHATELGVAAFVPLACERSIVRLDARKGAARRQRWRAIAKSAAMQSGQPAVPDVGEPAALGETCALLEHAAAVLVCWEEAPGTSRLEKALDRALGDRALPRTRASPWWWAPKGGLTSARWMRFWPATRVRRSCRWARPSCARRPPASWRPRSSCTSWAARARRARSAGTHVRPCRNRVESRRGGAARRLRGRGGQSPTSSWSTRARSPARPRRRRARLAPRGVARTIAPADWSSW